MQQQKKPLSPEDFARMVENTRWVQIMPAVGWVVEWKQEDLPGGKFTERVVCIALTKEGEVEFLTADGSGFVDGILRSTNLSRVYFNLDEYNKPDNAQADA